MKLKVLFFCVGLIANLLLCPTSPANEALPRPGANSRIQSNYVVSDSEKTILISSKNTILNFQNKNYPECIQSAQRYFKEGGSDNQIRRILAQCYFNVSDYVNAAREIQAEMLIAERNNKVLDEDRLILLYKAYVSLNDFNAQAWVLEKLVANYPKKGYWSSLLTLTQKRPDFRKNLLLDVQRLKFFTNTLLEPLDYFEMAQNALNQGFALEAKLVLDQGLASKVLSQSYDSLIFLQLLSEIKRKIDEEKRFISKFEFETPSPVNAFILMNVGLSLIHASEFDKGLNLMEKAVSLVPDSDRPQDARMHLAIAYLKAGKKTKALETFNLVGGVHGAADLSRLWAIFVKSDSI
jgi:tetratricopeptide (TPR) repeat protein